MEIKLTVFLLHFYVFITSAYDNNTSYMIYPGAMRNYEEFQKKCQLKRGSPACFKKVNKYIKEYLLDLWGKINFKNHFLKLH